MGLFLVVQLYSSSFYNKPGNLREQHALLHLRPADYTIKFSGMFSFQRIFHYYYSILIFHLYYHTYTILYHIIIYHYHHITTTVPTSDGKNPPMTSNSGPVLK